MSGILPVCIVVAHPCMICALRTVQQVVEFGPFSWHERTGRDIHIGLFLCKLPYNPFQGAAVVVVLWAKDAIVPMLEMLVLLIEVVPFLFEELVEMLECGYTN